MESVAHKMGAVIIAAIDVAFPIMHGTNGEDGTMQGLFELAGINTDEDELACVVPEGLLI